MPSTMPVTLGANNVMRVMIGTHFHVLESPRMSAVPVTVVRFVLHAIRISGVTDFLKIISFFIFRYKNGF
jgi:hypothetical protein